MKKFLILTAITFGMFGCGGSDGDGQKNNKFNSNDKAVIVDLSNKQDNLLSGIELARTNAVDFDDTTDAVKRVRDLILATCEVSTTTSESGEETFVTNYSFTGANCALTGQGEVVSQGTTYRSNIEFTVHDSELQLLTGLVSGTFTDNSEFSSVAENTTKINAYAMGRFVQVGNVEAKYENVTEMVYRFDNFDDNDDSNDQIVLLSMNGSWLLDFPPHRYVINANVTETTMSCTVNGAGVNCEELLGKEKSGQNGLFAK